MRGPRPPKSVPIAGPAPPRPPRPSGSSPTGKPPTLRGGTIFRQGPRAIAAGMRTEPGSGPRRAPEGFVRATTSETEWIAFYWAWIVTVGDETRWGGPRNPENWQGPPDGSFRYQIFVNGGRHSPGGAVPDFEFWGRIIVRIQTERHHVYTHNDTIIRDILQAARLTTPDTIVIDVWEQYMLIDAETRGGSAHRCMADAAQGIEWPSPIAGGNLYRTRR